MTSQSNCLVFLVAQPQEHSVVMADEINGFSAQKKTTFLNRIKL